MKIAVKYGLFITLTEVTLKLVLILTGKDAIFASEGLFALVFIYAGGLWLSIRATQLKEYNGVANPIQLLKAGLTSSAIFALAFALFSVGIKIAQNDLPPGGAPQMIIGVLFFFFLILITGGLFSVFISYILSKRKS
ncbi:MAG TPA: hypothetical protein VNZ86_13745 [Bacteroidia bacterium]|jgi:hypothetical protein|nr:hypothetical protein [Bacteroidia bacterium]